MQPFKTVEALKGAFFHIKQRAVAQLQRIQIRQIIEGQRFDRVYRIEV